MSHDKNIYTNESHCINGFHNVAVLLQNEYDDTKIAVFCTEKNRAMKDALTYKKVIGTVNFSADDLIFCGKVKGIDDLVIFEGSTVKELESAFRDMVDQHVADCE